MAEPVDDPMLEEHLDEALAPFTDLLPLDVLAEFRNELELFLTTHPAMSTMLARLRPPPIVSSSEEVTRNPKLREEEAARAAAQAASAKKRGA